MKKHKYFINSLFNKKFSKKVGLLSAIVVITLLLPFITNFLVTHLNFEHENEYVGFFGNYFGSIVAIAGVVLTIRYTTQQESENRRLQVIPYIEVEYVKDRYLTDQGSGITVGDYEKYNKRFLGHLKLQNVGLGSAIDLRIHDITFRGEEQNFSFGLHSVIRPDQTVCVNIDIRIFLQDITGMELEEMKRYINAGGTIVMNITYKDLLSNSYTQTIRLLCLVSLEYNPETTTGQLFAETRLNLDDKSKPKLVTG